MKFLRVILFGVFVLLTLFSSCKKTDISGDNLDNLPPKTYLVIDTLAISNDNRFSTQLNIQWWGDDPDGYVKGFEFTFDSVINNSTVWIFTTSNDSTFNLNIPAGFSVYDFPFAVRAVDNQDLVDPNPAKIRWPLKNTPPTIAFNYVPDGGNPLAGGNPNWSFPVIRCNWSVNDLDGLQNLKEVEVFLNDTNAAPYIVSATLSGITLEAEDLTASVSDALVYPGSSRNALPLRIQGMRLNDTNIVYIRAVDLSDAKSPLIASNSIYIKQPAGKVLLVNAYLNNPSGVDNFYNTALTNTNFPDFDNLELFRRAGNRFTRLAPDIRTQELIFRMFDHIIWYGSDMEQSLVYAQSSLNDFLNQGGQLMVSAFTSGSTLPKISAFEFSPIDSLDAAPAGFSWLLTDTSKIIPITTGLPQLSNSTFTSVIRPIKLTDGAVPWYRAEIIQRNNTNFQTTLHTGNSVVAGLRINPNTGSKFIIFTVEVHKLNKLNNADLLFSRIKSEFGL